MKLLLTLIIRLAALIFLFSGLMTLVAGGFVPGIILLLIGVGCIWAMRRRRRVA